MQKYERVLDLMRTKPNGRVELTDPELSALLDRKDKQNLMYRIATYMSFIRRYKSLKVLGIREGRKVVAYQLEALAAPTQPTQDESTPAVVSENASV